MVIRASLGGGTVCLFAFFDLFHLDCFDFSSCMLLCYKNHNLCVRYNIICCRVGRGGDDRVTK